MQNLNELEKSRGVVVFAFNSKTVNYIAIADQTAKLIEKFLNLPITLITDLDSSPNYTYDKIVRIENNGDNFRVTDNGTLTEWRNFGRYLAYQLSPYDETLLLDTDYLVLDSNLNKFWSQPFDYRIVSESILPEGPFKRHMSIKSHDWLWATVVFFRKTKKSEIFFNLIGRIQKNYGYYKTLFNLQGNYRNDFAFALADIIVNGYCVDNTNYLPFNMISIQNKVESIEIKNQNLVIRNSNRAIVSPQQNLHIMDKDYLTTEKFRKFVNDVTT